MFSDIFFLFRSFLQIGHDDSTWPKRVLMSANTPAQFPIELWGLFKSVLFVPPLVNCFAPRPVPQNPLPQPMSLKLKPYIPKPLKPRIKKPKQQVECKLCGYHCAAQNLEAHERCTAALVTGSGLRVSHGLELGCRSTQQQKVLQFYSQVITEGPVAFTL